MLRSLPAAAISLCLLACAADRPERPPRLGAPIAEPAPAPPASGEPFLAVSPAGDLLLSWTEATPDSAHALRFARRDGDEWGAPVTVAEGTDWFVNWADFPSILQLPDGSLAAHYLQRSGPGTYAYDVWLTRSSDGGATWSEPVRPHRDGTQTEHGFVSLFPHDGGLGAVWLDGRAYAGAGTSHDAHGGEMSLRFTTFMPGTAPAPEIPLDTRTCDCCQTAVAVTDGGPVVFYRDRSPTEIRDIHVVRLADGEWTQPAAVHEDGWEINACPVNGPAADARGDLVAVAWFTAAQDSPRVLVSFSTDGGATYTAPVQVDDGDPVGRVDLVLDDTGAAWVSWLENSPGGADIRVRGVTPAGTGEAVTAGSTSAARASGFPRLARHADALWLAWTEPGEPREVRLARVPIGR